MPTEPDVRETRETCPGCGEDVVRRTVTAGDATTTTTVHLVPGDDPDTRCRHDPGTYPDAVALEPYPGDTPRGR